MPVPAPEAQQLLEPDAATQRLRNAIAATRQPGRYCWVANLWVAEPVYHWAQPGHIERTVCGLRLRAGTLMPAAHAARLGCCCHRCRAAAA